MPSTAAGRYPDRMSLQWDPDGPARGRVVLLHGMTSLSATWWRIGPGLAARGWQVVAPDLPGHGTAARLSGPLDLDPLVEGVALHRDQPDRWLESVSAFADATLGS
jgi:alpha-beta hydrolase superfamily lysophospholipase